tara:strand:+ start:835 stop:981 length:147 start_codon:yes stop_codon:yes gene_type:complete
MTTKEKHEIEYNLLEWIIEYKINKTQLKNKREYILNELTKLGRYERIN